jgi:putative membrane protein
VTLSHTRLALLASLAFSACSSNPVTLTPRSASSAQDVAFLNFAAQSSNSEIAAANVALKQSTNQQVIAYANQMIADHDNANASEASFAPSVGVTPPTTPDPNEAAKLATYQSQTGVAFDQAYAADQAAAHQNTIQQFTVELQSGKNSAALAFAKAQLPILTNHLSGAQAIVSSGQ